MAENENEKLSLDEMEEMAGGAKSLDEIRQEVKQLQDSFKITTPSLTNLNLNITYKECKCRFCGTVTQVPTGPGIAMAPPTCNKCGFSLY